jgi:signal transduction histidine kinase
MSTFVLLSAVATVVVGVAAASRLGRAEGLARVRWAWVGAAVATTVSVVLVGSALSALLGWPDHLGAGAVSVWLLVPVAVGLGRATSLATVAERALVGALVVTGLAALASLLFVLVVLGLGPAPEDDAQTTLGLSIVAAALTVVLAVPAKRALEERANQRVYGERHAPDEALRTFGGRMSRAVPMDELLLQLAESLKKTLHLRSAEVWTGTDGRLERSVSVPDRGVEVLRLGAEELGVVARSRAQGRAWLQVWMPTLLEGRGDVLIRVVAVAHLGELLGLLVLERAGDDTPFTEEEDQVLVDLARQVGLALHNVGLDSALQASLDELEVRNAELVASRARIVVAADESRRQIERDLHDGAQQHLVALAVKVGLVKQLLGSDPDTAQGLLEELRDDVQATLTELRNLAHGIYPPLLRDRGLAEALRTAANRATLVTDVEVADDERYPAEVEAAIYFCILEAMQNAGKHAGETATVAVTVGHDDQQLWFEVHDDGAGFDPELAVQGHGFVNMRDRLGAVGGELRVQSAPGEGSTLRGTMPRPQSLVADAAGVA